MADHAAPHRPTTHQTVQQHLDALIPVINGWHDVPCDLALRALQDAVNGIAARPGSPTAGPTPGPNFPVDTLAGPGRQGTVPVVTPTPTPDRVTSPPPNTPPSPPPSPTPRPSRQEEQKGAPPVQPNPRPMPDPHNLP